MAYDNIQLSRDDGIITLTANRPENRNAMSPAMGEDRPRRRADPRRPGGRCIATWGAAWRSYSLEALQQGITVSSEDVREGIRAVIEKRTPEFRTR